MVRNYASLRIDSLVRWLELMHLGGYTEVIKLEIMHRGGYTKIKQLGTVPI